MFINKNKATRLWAIYTSTDGSAKNATSMALKLYLASIIAAAIDTTYDNLETGVYYKDVTLSGYGDAVYNLLSTATDTNEFNTFEQITLSANETIGDYDKARQSTINIPGSYAGADGAEADPDTSAKIYIYEGTTATPVVNGADMTKLSTGQYYYAFNISARNTGNYFALMKFVDGGKTYPSGYHFNICNSAASAYNVSDTGKPKIFDDNLLLVADTITEPTAKMGTTDIMDFIKDGRAETYVSLTDTAGQTHTFEYIFNAAVDLNFVEIKDCNAKTYTVSVDEGSGYVTLITGSFAAATDYAIWYSATTKSVTKIKYVFTSEKYDDTLTIKVGELIALTQVYEWLHHPIHYPVNNTELSSEQNWFGSYHVSKNRTWFSCKLIFDFITPAYQTDLNMMETLRARTTPFYYWLNGGKADANYNVISNVWKEKNIFRVYEVSKNFKENHKITDLKSSIDSNTLELLDAAYVGEV